jgi:hypothetical protein
MAVLVNWHLSLSSMRVVPCAARTNSRSGPGARPASAGPAAADIHDLLSLSDFLRAPSAGKSGECSRRQSHCRSAPTGAPSGRSSPDAYPTGICRRVALPGSFPPADALVLPQPVAPAATIVLPRANPRSPEWKERRELGGGFRLNVSSECLWSVFAPIRGAEVKH